MANDYSAMSVEELWRLQQAISQVLQDKLLARRKQLDDMLPVEITAAVGEPPAISIGRLAR